MNTTMTILGRQRVYTFSAVIHSHTSPDEFFLDPTDFYLKWGKVIPEGLHHEIEIVEPNRTVLLAKLIHIHQSTKSSGLFICYPPHIPTLKRALEVLKIWCLGTVLTWEAGVDLNTLRDSECGGDDELFYRTLSDRYGIRFVDSPHTQ